MKPGSEGVYVYALAEPGHPRHFTVLGRRLHKLPIGDVAAVIERRQPPDFTTDAVRHQHAIITRLTARLPVVLPARFGSLTDELSLRMLVSRHRPEILSAFEQARGCAQMTIRIFGTNEARPDETRLGDRTGTEFLERARERSKYVPPEAGIVRAEMAMYVKAERIAGGERKGLVTVFHLVPLERLDSYRRRASGLQPRLPRHVVTVTGPWPVFAFAPELF
jgi:Gas vesicle synthesis protein GvpL/GvpF